MAADASALDADRVLALSYAPGRARPSLAALWRLDATLGNVLVGGRDPMLSRIKLAWWREALERLDHAPPPAEPVLEAVARCLLPTGLRGGDLARLEEPWTVLLSPDALTVPDLALYAARGARLFRHSAHVLGASISEEMEAGGEAWALVDLARNSNPVDGAAALAAARERLLPMSGVRWPSRLRAIGMLAALAERDVGRGLDRLEPHGAPRRMARMMSHRIRGR